MSEEPRDWAEVRRKARQMAIARGHRVVPDPDEQQQEDPASVLPTTNVFALRGLLVTHHLTAAQERAARLFLADADRAKREEEARQVLADAEQRQQNAPTPILPGDAA